MVGSFPGVPCGVGDYTARLAEALLEADHEIQISVITSDDPRVDVWENPRLVIHRVRKWSAGEMPWLIKLVSFCRPDIIHIQYPAKGYGTGLAPNLMPLFLWLSRSRQPLVVTLHEFSIAHPLRRFSTGFMLGCADQTVVCDEREQSAVNRFLRLRGKEAVLLPLAPNIPVVKRHNPRPDYATGWTLSYFGFVDKSKDFTLLLEVLLNLRHEGFRVRLQLVGGIPLERQAELRTIAAGKGVKEGVSFTGFCPPETISRHLAESDVALFPFRDGVSLRRASFIAAMQHGLPVVTTRAKGYLPAGLRDGENVLLVEPGDVAGFTEAVRCLLLDAGLRVKLGAGAAHWAAAFTWERVALKHREFYREVLFEKNEVAYKV